MKLGCGFSPSIYVEDSAYRDLIRSHFDFVIPTWGMTPSNHFKTPDFRIWPIVVEGVEAAVVDGLEVHGHFLMSRFDIPSWIKDVAHSYTAGLELLNRTITQTVGFWGDRISDWIVANEMIGASGLAPTHPWVKVLGNDCLEIAFRAAYAANPKAKLWLKDFGIQHPAQWDAVFREVGKLKLDSVPIHGVGAHLHTNLFPKRSKYRIANFAAHLYPYHGVRINLMRKQISRAKSLGLDFQASEVLVFPGGDCDRRQKAMLKTYERYLDVAQSSGCSHFSYWCPVDDVRYPRLTWHWQGEKDYPGLWRWDEESGGYLKKG